MKRLVPGVLVLVADLLVRRRRRPTPAWPSA